jgi:hypothetical protein
MDISGNTNNNMGDNREQGTIKKAVGGLASGSIKECYI